LASAELLETRDSSSDARGVLTREKIVRRPGKYPYVRIEEKVHRDVATGHEHLIGFVAMVADHVIVKLRPGMQERDLEAIAASLNYSIRRKMRAPDLYLVAIGPPRAGKLTEAIDALGGTSGVINYIEPDYIVFASRIPNDPQFAQLWAMNNTGQSETGDGQVIVNTLSPVSYSGNGLTYAGTTGSNGINGLLIDCGIGDVGSFPSGVNGNIALIQRGTLTFAEKTMNAMTAGATAAVIFNNVGGDFSGTLGSSGNWIPVIAVSQSAGTALKNICPTNVAVMNIVSVGNDIHATQAWDVATGSTNVIVAVIDSGVDYTHPDLAGNMWVNQAELNGIPGVDDDGNGCVDDIYGYDFCNSDPDPMDDHFHGTHVAGTIGAVGNNGIGVVGVCWNVRIMALKFLSESGSGADSDAIECIYYAAQNGARILNNSWGGGGFSQAVMDAISAANSAGVLFVAAAGNSAGNNDQNPEYPASYNVPNVIAVAATGSHDELASFSCYGVTSVDLGAPGMDILSTLPTYMTYAMSQNGFSTGYGTASGTSMAAPHVSGALALLESCYPSLTAAQVKGRLLARVDPVTGLGDKVLSCGRLNVFNLVNSGWVGAPAEITVSGMTPDDSAGNGDGDINPGETIVFSPTFVNVGQMDATGVTATLTTGDSILNVLDSTVNIGAIQPLQPITKAAAFRMVVSGSVTNDQRVSVVVTTWHDGGHAVSNLFNFVVVRTRPQAHVEIHFKPGELLADPGRDVVYMIDQTHNKIIAFSMQAGRPVGGVALAGSPRIPNLSSATGSGSGQMAISGDGSTLYVAVSGAGRIQAISLPDMSSQRVFEYSFHPVSLACGWGNKLYASTDDYLGKIRQIDAITGDVLAEFNDGVSDVHQDALLAATADGSGIFVGETGVNVEGSPGYILEFDASSSGTPVLKKRHPFVEEYMTDFAVDENARRIYTVNGAVQTVQVTDMDRGTYDVAWPLAATSGAAVVFNEHLPYVYGACADSDGSHDVRGFSTVDGITAANYKLLQSDSSGKTMMDRHLCVTANGNLLGIKNQSIGDTNQGIEGYRYWVGVIGISNLLVEPINAVIDSSAAAGVAPLTVQFDGSGSSVTGGQIAAYAWDFGDGFTASGAVTSHTYAVAGVYTSVLTITDNYGYSGSTNVVVSCTRPAYTPMVRINFQPGYLSPPSGWAVDGGTAYDGAKGFGWINGTESQLFPFQGSNTNFDMIHRTYMFLYKNQVSYWEYAISNGDYQVTVCCGDPDSTNRQHYVAVEGIPTIDAMQYAAGAFSTGTVTVHVSDGRLTLQFGKIGTTQYGNLNWLTISTNLVPVDADSDGMPDAWEVTHFGNLSARPGDDADNDKVSNYEEFIAGTDPNDRNSHPAVFITCSNDVPVVWFQTIPATNTAWYGIANRFYKLETCTQVTATSHWSTVFGCERIKGAGAIVRQVVPSGDRRRFYRMRSWLDAN
jgi:subtilisin family serine protease